MKSINFDEGYKEYAINNDEQRVIRIRLSDMNLLKRVETAMKETKELVGKYKKAPSAEELVQFDSEVREVINKAFGSDICTPVLGSASVLTLATNGKLLLFEFFDAFLPVIKADIEAAMMTAKLKQPEIRPEVSKYLDPVTVAPVSKPIAGMTKPFGELPDVSGLTPEQKRQLMAQLIT
ncbi:MAG: hypothetical protein Q4A05_04780 [Ruminococcus sp.]|nr:hypothetical protein [Ruminococcus sp.]